MEGHLATKLEDADAGVAKITNSCDMSLLRDEAISLPDQESLVLRSAKIFRLRTVPEEKMDASSHDGRDMSHEFAKTDPRDEAHDTEPDVMFDFMFVKCFFVKLISACLYLYYSMSKVSQISLEGMLHKKIILSHDSNLISIIRLLCPDLIFVLVGSLLISTLSYLVNEMDHIDLYL